MAINQTILKDFILLGFSAYPHVQTFLFVVFSCLYILTLAGNLTIMGLTWVDRSLHTPMYLFLSALSFSETCYTLTIIPKMLVDLLDRDGRVSYIGCMTQLYFFIALACTECVLLAVMAYDRYLAICEPLRYPSLMPPSLATRLATASWGSGFFSSMMKLLFISRLSYCGPNINHYFCDISPLLNVSCEDSSQAELVDFFLALIVIAVPLCVVVTSYVTILVAILKIPSAQGRQKAFSTCASHLTVVTLFYSTTLFTYARPKLMYAYNSNKVVSVLYTIIVPLLNPIIYCLRNRDVKMALKKTILCIRSGPGEDGGFSS
ncbi:Olfactory receptor 6Y1 [Lemmus lemmus]